ncbi:MAG TPA: arginine--tRNA ligase [Mycobacteriales bacterium]|nr:arginine--tRNA ligase [Mycobacteriales bacterium]
MGPVERALAALVADATGTRLDVERAAPGAPGEFRVDARPLGEADGGDAVRALAKTLADLPQVEAAVAVPPRVYLRLPAAFLADTVVAAVRAEGARYGWAPPRDEPIVFSIGCPNANKPLHVGHLRNCFLGNAVSKAFETQGYDVWRTEELANFGLHVCQALVAYERWGGGATPESAGLKPDRFVGTWYTRFHEERLKLAVDDETPTELDEAAADLLRRQHAGDPDLLAVNERVTEWAIAGIRETYERIGLRHDFVLRELEALPVALALVEEGLRSGVCVRRDDGSVYVDLTDAGLGVVTLIRRDGTPLSLVCFVAIWVRRAQLHPHGRVVRITGEQWREGFSQFLEILRRLGHPEVADGTDGIWYGMIRSPDGKIRSRTGNEVSADALLDGFRDRFLSDWAAVLPSVEPYHRETCERLAVALLKAFILGKRREDTIVYDNDAVWRDTVPRLGRLAAALRLGEDPPPARPGGPTGKAARRLVADLALALNALPWTFARAAARYDAADVLGQADRVARQAIECERRGVLSPELAVAAGRVVRNALWALDVTLPSSPRELPPALDARR